MAFFQLYQEQEIPTSVDEMWGFISSPSNLSKITPSYMGFKITSRQMREEMYEGMIISYKVSPILGIKMPWVTEITHIKEKEYFVDEQRVGPYAMWHHEHILLPIENGVLMKDLVSYKPPFGFLGSIANALFIRKQLHEIFNYRRKVLENIFGEYK